MIFPDILVLLCDPRLPDRSKPGGRFTEDDYDQVRRLRQALSELTKRNFTLVDDHCDLYASLRGAAPPIPSEFLRYRPWQ